MQPIPVCPKSVVFGTFMKISTKVLKINAHERQNKEGF